MGLFCRLPTDETLKETYFAWNHAGWVKNVILSPGPTLPCLSAIYMTLINTLNSGLLNTYKSLFSLDDSLADIKSAPISSNTSGTSLREPGTCSQHQAPTSWRRPGRSSFSLVMMRSKLLIVLHI